MEEKEETASASDSPNLENNTEEQIASHQVQETQTNKALSRNEKSQAGRGPTLGQTSTSTTSSGQSGSNSSGQSDPKSN